MSDAPELDDDPEEIVSGLTVAVTDTGERYTVNAENLEGGELVLEADGSDDVPTSPGDLEWCLNVAGTYYIPEHAPAWEVHRALEILAGKDE